MSKTTEVKLWPPFKRSGTTITQRTAGDNVDLLTGSLSATTLGSTAMPNKNIYVDMSRTDTYTADGSILKPYKTILAALTVINADVGKNWVMNVASGTYADNLTITGPRLLRIVGSGVTISGTILINSGVGSYDRIEFVGVDGFRAEKGPAMTISGKITAERTNDSLIYVDFNGCLVSGEFEATTSGTWVLQYQNCRITGAITGTLAVNTQLDNTILIESYGFNEFVGAITGIVSFYNCHDSDFYCAITTTPWYENRFSHCNFTSTVSIIPQVGASSVLTYVDDISAKALMLRSPTLTGVTISRMEYMTGKGTDIASANDSVLTLTGKQFDVTGSVTMNGLLSTYILVGTEVILQFDDAPLVKHNTAASAGYASFQLAGAADFEASAGDVLHLYFDGTYWREISRTII